MLHLFVEALARDRRWPWFGPVARLWPLQLVDDVKAGSRGERVTESRRICLEKLGRSRLVFQQEAKVHEALLRHLFRL